MIYTTEDDDIASEASSLVAFDEDTGFNHPSGLANALTRVLSASLTSSPSASRNLGSTNRNYTPSRTNSITDANSVVSLSASISLPNTPTTLCQSISEKDAAFLARVCKSDEFSAQAIAFSRQLLLPHLNTYSVHRRIALLFDITNGCKDFSKLEQELPFAILETVNDAFDSTIVGTLSPSLGLLSQALRYNTKAFASSGAFPLLGLILAKLFLIFKDAKLFDQLVEISDIVVKRWILADMKDSLNPFLQSFITASGRFWPALPPPSAQQLMRTLVNGCHNVVSIQALFDCASGQISVGEDPSLAILGAFSTIRHILMEIISSNPLRSTSPAVPDPSASNDSAQYTRKLISESALPLVSNLICNNRECYRYPKIFIEVVELLTVIANSQSHFLKTGDNEKDFWIVLLHCIENLDVAVCELLPSSGTPSIGANAQLLRSSATALPAASHSEPVLKYNTLLLAVMNQLDDDSPHFGDLFWILLRSPASPAMRSLEVITKLCNYFCDFYLAVVPRTSIIFIDIQSFLVTFYMKEMRQSVRECILSGLSGAFISRPELISEMVVSVVIETIFATTSNGKPRPLITDTSSSKSSQAALSFMKQLFHATRPARNRHFFISQALNILFIAANSGCADTLIESLSRDIFGIIAANITDSLTCTAPVLMKTVETFSSELARRFEPSATGQEMMCWRPTLLRFLCLCSSLDANSLGHVIVDKRFVESACLFVKLEDLWELLNSSSNLVLYCDKRDMILIPGLKWSAELSVPVVSLKLLAWSLKNEKDPLAFKCFASLTGRFFAKRRVLQHYASPPLFALVNELIDLLCRCAATSIKRHMQSEAQQMVLQHAQHLQQVAQLAQNAGQSQSQHQQSQTSVSNSSSSSQQMPPVLQLERKPSPYDLHTIFKTFLLVPPLDFALDDDRRKLFFVCLSHALKTPVTGEAMDCLTLCLIHMSPKRAQERLDEVTLELSKLVSSASFAPNVILLVDTLRSFIKRGSIVISQNSFLAVFSLVLSFTNPCRFGYFYSSLAFNSMFAWFLDSPVHLRPDLGAYVLKQLAGYRAAIAENPSTVSAAGVRYYDEMTELTRDVVTEHNSRRCSDFEPNRLTEFEGALTWFLDNDRIVSFKKDPKISGCLSVLVRSPSSVSIFSLQRTVANLNRHHCVEESDSFDNDVAALVATFFGSSAALTLRKPPTTEAERGLKNFDLILPFQKFKIGILFCGPGQNTEEAILSNCFGTPRYERFIEKLGHVTRLVVEKDGTGNTQFLYTGGLDTGGDDGRVALTYVDEYCQVAYHIATLMPNHVGDPKRNSKKRHIGNDYVIIIYNASGSTPQHQRDGIITSVISGSFAYATIVITPLLDGNSLVQLFGKNDMPRQLRWNTGKAMTIPEAFLPEFVRLLAMQADITARCSSDSQPVAFNWLERLRALRRLRSKLSTGQIGAVVDVSTPEVVYQ